MSVTESRTAASLCWLAGALVLAVGAWVVCYLPNCAETRLDAAVMTWFAERRSESADQLFRSVTWLGSVAILGPLAAASALMLAFIQRFRETVFLAMALAGIVVIMHFSKLMIARPRPSSITALIDMPSDPSFPSAHSAQIAGFMLGAIIVLARMHRALARRLIWLAMLLVLLVGVSRIYLQVHFPTDVLAGLMVGLSWVGGLALWIFPRAPAPLHIDAQ